MDKLAKVRAEIERRRDRHSKAKRIESALEDNAILSFIDSMQEEPKECMYSKDNYTDEDRKALCDGCEEDCKFNKKEEPVSEDLEEAIDSYLATYFGGEKEKQNWPFLKKMAIHFAEWQKQKDSIPVSEELSEAANFYADTHTEWFDADNNPHVSPAFEAGAEWQKQQMEAYRIEHCKSLTNEQAELEENFVSSHVENNNRIPTFIDAIEYGIEYGKQQLMAKAVDATVHIDVGGYPYIPQMELYDYEKDIPFAKEGDKYKVILIKEE